MEKVLIMMYVSNIYQVHLSWQALKDTNSSSNVITFPIPFSRFLLGSFFSYIQKYLSGASLVVQCSPANAEDMGSIPRPGRFHMPCATTAEAACPTQSPCSTMREATAMRSPHTTTREQPQLAATREGSSAARKTQHIQETK